MAACMFRDSSVFRLRFGCEARVSGFWDSMGHFLYENIIKLNLPGNAFYHTNCLLLLLKNMLCGTLHCQKGFNIVLFSYEIAREGGWHLCKAHAGRVQHRVVICPLFLRRPSRDQGSGFRVQGSGFRVQGAGFRVQGAGCRVHPLGVVGVHFAPKQPHLR